MYSVFCDGACRGNGQSADKLGRAAAGVAIYRNKRLVGQCARGLGRRTNNEAEYEALILGLLMAWSADFRAPTIYSDSQLVVNQVNGTWVAPKSSKLLPLFLSVKEIQAEFGFKLVLVDRSFVSEADALANAFLDREEEYEQLRRLNR